MLKKKTKLKVRFSFGIRGVNSLPAALNGHSIALTWRRGKKLKGNSGVTAVVRDGATVLEDEFVFVSTMQQHPRKKTFSEKVCVLCVSVVERVVPPPAPRA